MTGKLRSLCIAILALAGASPGFAEDNAAAMVTRIEPADSGIAKVMRNGKSEEVAFMMPLYAGDELVVESPNTVVQVKIFGGADAVARLGEPLKIEEEAEERGMFGSMMSALSDKVFRSNQMSRRNLVTRSDGDSPALALFGFDAGAGVQNVIAGKRSLIVRWNLDLDSVRFELQRADARVMVEGESHGDFAFIDDAVLESGEAYTVEVESVGGLAASGEFVAVDALPELHPVDPELGTVGRALQLLELAEIDDGKWKFEAIQGVLDLSPDDIDRATLISEISAL